MGYGDGSVAAFAGFECGVVGVGGGDVAGTAGADLGAVDLDGGQLLIGPLGVDGVHLAHGQAGVVEALLA